MHPYIKTWNNIIMNGSFDNTYKMAWAKAIVELSLAHKANTTDKPVIFDFSQIAELFIKYYWNQTIYFDLIQGSNVKKIPEILSATKALISTYFNAKGDCLPERFEKIDFNAAGLNENYELCLKKAANTLKQDVCYRFKKVGGEDFAIYELDLKNRQVILTNDQANLLADHAEILFQIINYRWTQMIETFNHSPRISMKVRSIDENKIRRSNLSSFHKYLDLEFSDGKRYCFHCGQEIAPSDLSVDHVIPWSFMFSDDIWNLVYCHKSENSSKSNSSPTEEMINKLEARNNNLLAKYEASGLKLDKKSDELKLAIEKDYVRKFWVAAKG